MANYNVDIELAVKGNQRVEQQLKRLEKLVVEIGSKAKAIDLGGQVRLKGEQRILKEKIKNFGIAQKELKVSQEIARLASQRARGLSQFGKPIGPSASGFQQFQKEKQRILENAQLDTKIAKQISQIELALDRKLEMAGLEREMNIFKNKEKLAVQSFNNEKKRNKQQVADFDKRLRQATAARSAAGKQKSKNRSDLALGIGFPLLFGGGAGSIAGGALGALGGGGMGGQVLGSAIGGQLDQFAQRTTSLAQALRGAGDVTQELEGFIGVLNSETSRRIRNLQESGQTARAADAAFKELSKTIGVDNAKALVQAGKDFETLGNKTTQFFTILGASIAGLFQEAFYLNLRDPLSDVPAASPELLNARRLAGQDLQLSQLETAAVRARGTDSFEDDAAADKALIRQRELNSLAEFDRQVKEGQKDAVEDINERLKITEDASRAILQIDQDLLKSNKQRNKETERLAEKTRREEAAYLKKIAREEEKRFEKAKRLEVSLNAESIKAIDIAVESARVFQDEEAAIVRQLNLLERRKEFEADSIRLNTENLQLEDLKLSNLDNEYNRRQEILLQTLEQLRLTEQIFALSSAAGFDVLSVANNIAPFQRGMGTEGSPASFEAGMELAPLIAYQLELDKILEKYPLIGEAAGAAAGLITTGFESIIDGTKSAEQVFADFLNSIADMLLKTAQQMIAQYIALGVARMFAGFNPSSFSSFSGSMSGNPFAAGGTLDFFPTVGQFADGGRPPVGRPSIVGERGPELFVPGASGTIIPNHAMGGVNVGTINITVENTGEQLNPAAQKQLAGQVQGIVLSTLANERRSGGML